MKPGGQVGCVTMTNWLDFGEDLYPNTRIFSVIVHNWEMGPKMIRIVVSRNNLSSVSLLKLHRDVSYSSTDHAILYYTILFSLRDSSIYAHKHNNIQHRIRSKKLWMDYNKTWWMSWLDDKNKPFRFCFSSADPAYQLDTRCSVRHGRGMRSTESRSSLRMQ